MRWVLLGPRQELLFGDALAQRDFSDPSVEGAAGEGEMVVCWMGGLNQGFLGILGVVFL